MRVTVPPAAGAEPVAPPEVDDGRAGASVALPVTLPPAPAEPAVDSEEAVTAPDEPAAPSDEPLATAEELAAPEPPEPQAASASAVTAANRPAATPRARRLRDRAGLICMVCPFASGTG